MEELGVQTGDEEATQRLQTGGSHHHVYAQGPMEEMVLPQSGSWGQLVGGRDVVESVQPVLEC